MTNTHTTNMRPEASDQLNTLIATISFAVSSIERPPLPGEQGFEEYLNNQALLQQLNLAQRFQIALDLDPANQVAAAGLLKALALVERSRTRVTRPTKNDPNSPKIPRERDDAVEFLKAELLSGPRAVSDLMPRARELGISAATLRRAKIDLNIASNLHVMPDKERFWSWSLPEHAHFADHSPPQPRPKCTMTDAECDAFQAEKDAFYATQPAVSDDLGRPVSSSMSSLSTHNSALSTLSSSALSTQNSPLSTPSGLSTQNSALSTSTSTPVFSSKSKDAHMLT